jgi:two-component system, OmpR family, alkaline phosphatase synthesis response regulator PhoP
MNKGEAVIIIEDSQVQRAIIVNLVKELGYVPLVVEQINEKIADNIKNESAPVVLLDLMLLDEQGIPVVDGFQLCNDIKESNPRMKVIIVSAENDTAAREFASLQGADGFLGKPFKIDELERCLKDV